MNLLGVETMSNVVSDPAAAMNGSVSKNGVGPIPFVDLAAQHGPIRGEIDDAIKRVIDRSSFIQGDEVAAFEAEFASYCEARFAVGVSSGTDALYLALLACGVGPGDEVITTAFTFIATAEAISQAGAVPVFVDIDPRTMNLDPTELKDAITEATKAIIPVHLYGQPVDMDPVMSIAQRYGLQVIEDAAQAHGSRYHGRRAGTIGDIGCFSFFPGKNLGAFGDAGAIVTNHEGLAERIRLLRDHGRQDKYEHLLPGTNSRLDTLQAAILRVKLRHLDDWNAGRRSVAEAYAHHLKGAAIELPKVSQDVDPVYHLYVVRSEDRDGLRERLGEQGIATGIHYPIPLHMQPAYRSLDYAPGDFPEAERAADEVLSLPMYPDLPLEWVREICSSVKRAARVHARHTGPALS